MKSKDSEHRANRVATQRKQSFYGLCVIPLFALCLITGCQSDEEIKRQKYITEGILVYQNNCANCHQTKGEGLGTLYPPLAKSDFLADKKSVICLIRYGQQGQIVVNGKTYNHPMPAQPRLSDLEIAEVVTYIYNQWGNEKKLTGVKQVTPILEACKEGQ